MRKISSLALIIFFTVSSSSAHGAEDPSMQLVPGIQSLDIKISNSFIDDVQNTIVKVNVSARVGVSHLKNINLILYPAFKMSGLDAPSDDQNCTQTMLLDSRGAEWSFMKSSGLSSPITSKSDDQFSVETYSFTNSIWKSPTGNNGTFDEANYCSGEWKISSFEIRGEFPDKTPVAIAYFRRTFGADAPSFIVVPSWDANPQKATCPKIPNTNFALGNVLVGASKYRDCLNTLEITKTVGIYDKNASLKQARIDQEKARAEQVQLDKELAKESAVAEKENQASLSAKGKKVTLYCAKGALIKKVVALKPKCPSGYKVKK